MVSFPYYSHIFTDSYGSGMEIVWEAYHKGVPLLGVPENPIDKMCLETKPGGIAPYIAPFQTKRTSHQRPVVQTCINNEGKLPYQLVFLRISEP